MKKGDLILIAAGVPYVSLSCEVTYLAVNFDYTSNHRHLKNPIPPTRAGKEEARLVEQVEIEDAPFFNGYFCARGLFSVSRIIRRMLAEDIEKPLHYEIAASAALLSILAMAERAREGRHSACALPVREIVSYVHDNLGGLLTNKMIAETFHFHPNYLSKEFKDQVGISLHRYVIRERISAAIVMLERGEKSIAEISHDLGFCDVAHFSRCFKSETGCSPRKYRI